MLTSGYLRGIKCQYSFGSLNGVRNLNRFEWKTVRASSSPASTLTFLIVSSGFSHPALYMDLFSLSSLLFIIAFVVIHCMMWLAAASTDKVLNTSSSSKCGGFSHLSEFRKLTDVAGVPAVFFSEMRNVWSHGPGGWRHF